LPFIPSLKNKLHRHCIMGNYIRNSSFVKEKKKKKKCYKFSFTGPIKPTDILIVTFQ
jgi:hypothetical protein